MPFVENQGARIHWDDEGRGAPLLLITGLGLSSSVWFRVRPALATHYRTIALSNRGVGRSEAPPGPCPIPLLASDAAAVLDAAGVDRAHVFGMSLGGMIALELALTHPDRVSSLILGATAARRPSSAHIDPALIGILRGAALQSQTAWELLEPFIYHRDTARETISEDRAAFGASLSSPESFAAQLRGILFWEASRRLSTITAPTLVLHGEADRLLPPSSGELIWRGIAGAEMVLLRGASHLFTSDQPEATVEAIRRFLSRPY